ncbi:MAG: hypothetical protein ABUS51_06820, partial [Acidobacteriota bacterium]
MIPAFRIADALPWLVSGFVVRSSLLCLACTCALRLFRDRGAALEYAAWRFVLLAMLLLPVLEMMAPVIPIPAPFIPSADRMRPLRVPAQRPMRTEKLPVAGGPVAARVGEPGQPAGARFPWAFLALAAYLPITGMMLSRILVGSLLLHRAAQAMPRLEDPRLLECANLQCARLGLLTFPEFRGAERVSVPVTFGWQHPVILLPGDWNEWPAAKLDLV